MPSLLRLTNLFNEKYHCVYTNSFPHRWRCDSCENLHDVFGCPCTIEIAESKFDKIFAHAPPSWWTMMIAEESNSDSEMLYLFKICFPDNTPSEVLAAFSEIESLHAGASIIFNKFTKKERPLVFVDLFKKHLKKNELAPIDIYAASVNALDSREFLWWFRLYWNS
jgi:hypothetical protein